MYTLQFPLWDSAWIWKHSLSLSVNKLGITSCLNSGNAKSSFCLWLYFPFSWTIFTHTSITTELFDLALCFLVLVPFPHCSFFLSSLLPFLFVIVASLSLFLHVYTIKSNAGFLVLLIWLCVDCPVNIPQIIIDSFIAAWIRMLENSAPLLILKWCNKIKSFKILLLLCVETWNFEYPVSLWH